MNIFQYLDQIMVYTILCLLYFWLGVLLIFVIKAMITKSELDKKKRNMVLIKCVAAFAVGRIGVTTYQVLFTAVQYSPYSVLLGARIFGILVMILTVTILLAYSGTPLIFFKERVQYPWPFHFLNGREHNAVEQ